MSISWIKKLGVGIALATTPVGVMASPTSSPAPQHNASALADIAMDANEVLALQSWLSNAPQNAESFRAHVQKESLLLEVEQASPKTRLRNLKGLQPEFYQKRRRPEPEVGREIGRASIPAASAMDLFLSELTLADGALRAPLTANGVQEDLALGQAILLHVGRSQHWARGHFLQGVADASQTHPVLKRVALVSLGRAATDNALPRLRQELADPKSDLNLKSGAVHGIASLKTPAALRTLEEVAHGGTAQAPAHAALMGMATFAAQSDSTVAEPAARALIRAIDALSIDVFGATLLQAVGVANHRVVDRYLQEASALAKTSAQSRWLKRALQMRSFAARRNVAP